MLIRSQDKCTLINFNGSFVLEVVEIERKIRITCSGAGSCYSIGRYSSEEKALKVLDMIEEAYTKTGFAKAIVSEMAKVLGRASAGIDDELAKSAGGALVKLMCFQMPADNEVEV